MTETACLKDAFIDACVFIDIEVEASGRIKHLGAVAGDRDFRHQGEEGIEHALKLLDAFAAGARWVSGHNIIGHDLPLIRKMAPELRLLDKPAVDTLCLSPIAFPQNPYHHLIKGYKLVRTSANDPLEDARLSRTLFTDEWEALIGSHGGGDVRKLSFYRYCFDGFPEWDGIRDALSAMGGEATTGDEANAYWSNQFLDRGCCHALAAIGQKAFIGAGAVARPALAYVGAWLGVAGSNSVLPAWVTKSIPLVVSLVQRIRCTTCYDLNCDYCSENHNAVAALRRYFGFQSFRAAPANTDGGSLQQDIVEASMRGVPLLGILPTGGGKSLCYQIPALNRYFLDGSLTIVLSPLQALMKDQVDNLSRQTGTTCAVALYGLLTPLERADVLEGIRLGDVGLLYVSPEQLRNPSFRNAIVHRRIGSWIFDEAHCLSKWGHDFRPDYLYASRFIAEQAGREGDGIPPIACFTATAKPAVRDEIAGHFREGLGLELAVFESTVERENLSFVVETVLRREKFDRVVTLIGERLPEGGAGIVYASTRRRVEQLAEYLIQGGVTATAFHAGLTPPRKRDIQTAFMEGAIPVICATTAFGMGIDKGNIRLVIHVDLPGSLENYLQEAGRAGRDLADAVCILLYDEQDAERQFALGALSQLSQYQIAQILRRLRQARRRGADEVILTAGELLRDEAFDFGIDADDRDADTRVKMAIAWLERGGFVERNENQTRVFQGQPRVGSLDEAKARMTALNVPERKQEQWTIVLRTIINQPPDQGLTMDTLAEALRLKEPAVGTGAGLRTGEQALRILQEMTEAGLLRSGVQLTAYVRHKVENSSRDRYSRVCAVEAELIKALREEAPDAPEEGETGWHPLALRKLNQRLLDAGAPSSVELLRDLLKSHSRDGRGQSRNTLAVRPRYQDHYVVRVEGSWDGVTERATERRVIGSCLLKALLGKIDAAHSGSSELLVEITYEELDHALATDIETRHLVEDRAKGIERGLLFLHETGVLSLQHGMAIFRQAMTIRLVGDNRSRYTKEQYRPLVEHYREQRYQIHVMNEYARMGSAEGRQSLALVLDYFAMNKAAFTRKYFPGLTAEALERPTTVEGYRTLVGALNNDQQEAIVTSPDDENTLILAGPGSGKTRVVVHRCAYLLRVQRVPASSILILCYNRHAVIEIRRRLKALVGEEGSRVTALTYHGLALRLTGRTLTDQPVDGNGLDAFFQALMMQAAALLNGQQGDGYSPDEQRDRLLTGFQYILVDEYQDIDEAQYTLIAAMVGHARAVNERKQDEDTRRLTLLAVGDDDQNIYAFRRTSVVYIHRFREDYGATVRYLTENYRSSRHIVTAANQLIGGNRDRMKMAHPITVNRERTDAPAGGRWASLDPETGGRVVVLEVHDEAEQALAVGNELIRLRQLEPLMDWTSVALICTKRKTFHALRATCASFGIPASVRVGADGVPNLARVRELHEWLTTMAGQRDLRCRATEIINALVVEAGNPWRALLLELSMVWRDETGDARMMVGEVLDWFYETLGDLRRDQQIGNGVAILTAHGAKGLEFDHVFVLDDVWGQGCEEEQRRLYYVALTRARETAWLLRRDDLSHPFVGQLNGESVIALRRTCDRAMAASLLGFQYELLGLSDLFLDYAALDRHEAGETVRRLAALETGDALRIARIGAHLRLLDADGYGVAQLSAKGQSVWEPRMEGIVSVSIIALHRRLRGDAGVGRQLYADVWELPVVEVVYKGGRH